MTDVPRVIIVGADKGGVGKTTVARLLIDYMRRKKINPRIIDTQDGGVGLKKFYPDADLIDMTTDAGQVSVLDRLGDWMIIDIRAGLLSPALENMRQIGFLDDVGRGNVLLSVLHVLGPTAASLDEMKNIAPLVASASYFVVKNHINAFEWDARLVDKAKLITVPFLSPESAFEVDQLAMTFDAFIASDKSYVHRGRVRFWVDGMNGEFDRAKIAS